MIRIKYNVIAQRVVQTHYMDSEMHTTDVGFKRMLQDHVAKHHRGSELGLYERVEFNRKKTYWTDRRAK